MAKEPSGRDPIGRFYRAATENWNPDAAGCMVWPLMPTAPQEPHHCPHPACPHPDAPPAETFSGSPAMPGNIEDVAF
jgi:hypothetical protein